MKDYMKSNIHNIFWNVILSLYNAKLKLIENSYELVAFASVSLFLLMMLENVLNSKTKNQMNVWEISQFIP